MKFYFAMEKIMFTFFLFTGEIKWNLISEEVEVKRPIKNLNKPECDIEISVLEGTIQAFIREVLL